MPDSTDRNAADAQSTATSYVLEPQAEGDPRVIVRLDDEVSVGTIGVNRMRVWRNPTHR